MNLLQSYPQSLQNLFSDFRASGGILDYAIFELNPGEKPDYTSANTQAVHQFSVERGDTQTPTYETHNMTSTSIDIERFMGPYYDIAAHKLIIEPPTHMNGTYPAATGQPHAYFYYDLPVTPDHALQLGGHTLPHTGYAYAFSCPPHGAKSVSLGKLMEVMNEILFHSFADVEIREWSTNWSNYFDPGHEWWGAFWWTVYDKSANRVIVIGGSTSD